VTEELLRGDQYESLWTDFLASLQQENNHRADEQPTSIVTTTTEDDDNDDDPEFRLPDTDYDLEDDLDDELHVSSRNYRIGHSSSQCVSSFFEERELALLLEDNASLLNAEVSLNKGVSLSIPARHWSTLSLSVPRRRIRPSRDYSNINSLQNSELFCNINYQR
jgi:hypothetical protein